MCSSLEARGSYVWPHHFTWVCSCSWRFGKRWVQPWWSDYFILALTTINTDELKGIWRIKALVNLMNITTSNIAVKQSGLLLTLNIWFLIYLFTLFLLPITRQQVSLSTEFAHFSCLILSLHFYWEVGEVLFDFMTVIDLISSIFKHFILFLSFRLLYFIVLASCLSIPHKN